MRTLHVSLVATLLAAVSTAIADDNPSQFFDSGNSLIAGLRNIDANIQQIQNKGVVSWLSDQVTSSAQQRFPDLFGSASGTVKDLQTAGTHLYDIGSQGMAVISADAQTISVTRQQDPQANEQAIAATEQFTDSFLPAQAQSMTQYVENKVVPQSIRDAYNEVAERVNTFCDNTEWLANKIGTVVDDAQVEVDKVSDRIKNYIESGVNDGLEPTGADEQQIRTARADDKSEDIATTISSVINGDDLIQSDRKYGTVAIQSSAGNPAESANTGTNSNSVDVSQNIDLGALGVSAQAPEGGPTNLSANDQRQGELADLQKEDESAQKEGELADLQKQEESEVSQRVAEERDSSTRRAQRAVATSSVPNYGSCIEYHLGTTGADVSVWINRCNFVVTLVFWTDGGNLSVDGACVGRKPPFCGDTVPASGSELAFSFYGALSWSACKYPEVPMSDNYYLTTGCSSSDIPRSVRNQAVLNYNAGVNVRVAAWAQAQSRVPAAPSNAAPNENGNDDNQYGSEIPQDTYPPQRSGEAALNTLKAFVGPLPRPATPRAPPQNKPSNAPCKPGQCCQGGTQVC